MGIASVVRRQHHVLKFEKLGIDIGFVPKHVQTCASNAFVFQSLDQGGLVNHTATRNIDNDAFGSQRLEDLGIDHIFGVVTSWNGHYQIV